MRTGTAELPLHGGRCPPWLFGRMRRLGGAVVRVIVEEFGKKELLRRMGDPFFFQSLGCALGYDWHSSGLSTVTLGALKEGVDPREVGLAFCGGKGRASRKTPEEILRWGELFSLSSSRVGELQHASRMAAKVDNACVQDGYQLYHHSFILTEDGDWAVVQQGMRERWARRYHWVSEGVRSFVEEPHSGIAGERKEEMVLDMTARESEGARRESVELAKRDPQDLLALSREAEQTSLDEYLGLPPKARLLMPGEHGISRLTKETLSVLRRVREVDPKDYEELVAIRGVGPKTVRALALLSALIYGRPPSWRDPVRYSFTVGGKDGVPYPVDRKHYDEVVEFLQLTLEEAKVEREERLKALRRLARLAGG
ncbi:MAG: DUF763 domain-containing protein [Candidatus Hadarchaeales archaeon]